MSTSRDPAWLSWEEAAAVAGVRVPTVEHAVRMGRIARRPRHGRQGTLDRASVLAWAQWHRDHKQERAARASDASLSPVQVERVEPDPATWLSTTEAARILSVSPATVRRLVRTGELDGLTARGRRIWVGRSSVTRLAEQRHQWVSWNEASEVIGCPVTAIPTLVAEGLLVQRDGPRAMPSLERRSVEECRGVWQQRQQDRALRRQARSRPRSAPPDDGQVWLNAVTSGLVLGLSANRVRQMVRQGFLPGQVRGGRLWLRRSDVEAKAAAKAIREQFHGP